MSREPLKYSIMSKNYAFHFGLHILAKQKTESYIILIHK